ncbi:MAG: NADH-quinone oxidoreductase subunit L [Chloroflexi bacterium AL-W]|nr:NADH-quinone oxidoreductase subunit L [Chloroflexi bacterium AL-N1]NOK69416.1 NADH-quinone oxidoreductase subunit L [Chloroflexi bacterium AL-N10]NOK76477.1 NADH-quinone oxidoreductase subunit L [Chloroflexi bacterium AL-N5]NOK83594.1 NADH-quinone oxidoreductase subunit L [Chloroflexi bacterium AL-W]NOK91255.1 NADH-quinone oxidoreductase subunit L [Chloroflexi bacterium AL-N15]
MSQLSWVIALIPAFPLLGFLINALFIRREREAGLVASGAVILSFLATLVSIYVLQTLPEESQRINFVMWQWISIGTFQVPFGLLFDQLTVVMALLITGVGAIIHVYSIGYMRGDSRPVRFFAYMNLFIFAMLVLVMADNLLLMFLGWEGVGVCSYLLISHYFDQRLVQPGIVPSEGATKAFIVNRVGDIGLLLAMFALFSQVGTLTFYGQFSPEAAPTIGFLDPNLIQQLGAGTLDFGFLGTVGVATAICLLLLLGAVGKSAQFPLYTWLPDAMAGPTPVSALIHAATMVTSGVYLIARTHTLFAAAPTAQGFVVAIGLVTALLAATSAVAQTDIKRVLAYSTISQLGYMIVAVGMGAIVAGLFHLLMHGIFKALLFMAAGSVIHGAHDIQDMRRMGGFRKIMPITFWTYLIGALGLAGIFPLAGFWSKEEIIAYSWFTAQNPGIAIILVVTSILTALYMGRQIALIFYGRQRDVDYEAHESNRTMTTPLIILAVGTVIGGVINLPGLHWLNDYLFPVINEAAAEYTVGKAVFAVVVLVASVGGGYLGWWLYAKVLASRIRFGREDPGFRYLGDIWRGAEIGWGIDWFYERVIIRGHRGLSRFLNDVFDRQGIDGILVEGIGYLFSRLSGLFRRTQSGYIRNYMLVFMVGVVVLVGYFAFQAL